MSNMGNLVDAKVVARMLDLNVRGVYRLAKDRKLACVQWGRQIRFRPEDVAQFVDAHSKKAIDYEALADSRCV